MRPIYESRQLPPDESFILSVVGRGKLAFYWHSHLYIELTSILEGGGRRFVGDHIGRYRDGDLTLTGSWLPHTWISDSSAKKGRSHAIFIQIPPDFLNAAVLSKPEFEKVGRLLEEAGRGLAFYGKAKRDASAILSEMKRRDGLARVIGVFEALRLLSLSSPTERESLASPAYSPQTKADSEGRAAKVLALIHKGAGGKVRLEALAKASGMSRSSFIRFFRRTTGRNLVEYVNEIRIGKACQLLLETDLPVAEISLRCGFGSLPYFNRRFLAMKGLVPSRFRNIESQSVRR